MTQWEYTEEKWDAKLDKISQLNRFGQQGWELIDISYHSGVLSIGEWYNRVETKVADDYYIAIFKRPR